MTRIKVGELKEINKQIEEIVNVDYRGLDLEIRQHLNILDKIGLTSSIASGCINREDGLFIVNHGAKEIAYNLVIIEKYTNLTLPKSEIEGFDLINRSGILDAVLENIPKKELSALSKLLEDSIIEERNKYNQENRLENIIKKGVDGLLQTLKSLPTAEEMGDLPQELTGAFTGIMEKFKQLEPNEQEYVGNLVDKTIGAE